MLSANKMTELEQRMIEISDLSALEFLHRSHCKSVARNGPGYECETEQKKSTTHVLMPYRLASEAPGCEKSAKIMFSKYYLAFAQGLESFRYYEILEVESNCSIDSERMGQNRQIHFMLMDEKEFSTPWNVRKTVVKFLCNKETSIARLTVPFEHSDQATCTRYVPLFKKRSMNFSECVSGTVNWARYSLFEFTQADLKVFV